MLFLIPKPKLKKDLCAMIHDALKVSKEDAPNDDNQVNYTAEYLSKYISEIVNYLLSK